ncbi:MAG: phosphodiester glycosidase family protein, partial [Deltaproteobacteria bacterium]|nr:phosphodiester glycosidase family protein [Deltaproteobacteria bacterium]
QSLSGLPSRPSRRALIGIDKEQRLVIAVTDTFLGGLSWVELQELFTAPKWKLQTHDLLALDGGGSAQVYIKTANHEDLIPGTSDVPVAIGFFAKTQ